LITSYVDARYRRAPQEPPHQTTVSSSHVCRTGSPRAAAVSHFEHKQYSVDAAACSIRSRQLCRSTRRAKSGSTSIEDANGSGESSWSAAGLLRDSKKPGLIAAETRLFGCIGLFEYGAHSSSTHTHPGESLTSVFQARYTEVEGTTRPMIVCSAKYPLSVTRKSWAWVM